MTQSPSLAPARASSLATSLVEETLSNRRRDEPSLFFIFYFLEPLANPQLQLGDLSFLPTDITALPLRRLLAPLPRRHSRREWRRGRGKDQNEQSSPTTRRLNLTIPQL